MKKRIRKTPWYPGSIKPVREGEYERLRISGNIKRNLWNGKAWHYWDYGFECWLASTLQNLEWRGQTKP